MTLIKSGDNAVILFDGVCNLCNASVQFIIKRDPRGYFHFASLQSEAATALLSQYGYRDAPLASVLLVENGQIYDRSAAALRIARRLSGAWKALTVFTVVPPVIRNAVYNWIARNRYDWFGKRDECMIPTPDLQARFLD